MAIGGGALRRSAPQVRSDMAEPASRADLAIAMQLLRASNMKAVRLQLALFGRNRKQALESIDGLVDLDGEIASFIADMPPVSVSLNELNQIAGWIDEQKAAIASEKMALVCAIDGPAMQAGDDPLPVAAANSDEPDDEAMHLGGFEIGSKRILTGIEEQAFDQPAPKERPLIHANPAEIRKLSLLETNTRELQLAVAEVDERVRRIPGRAFMLSVLLGAELVAVALIFYGDAIKSLINMYY